MKNKFKILILIGLIATVLVGCDDAETKEFKSLYKLGYEQGVEQYHDQTLIYRPIDILDDIIGDGSVWSIESYIEKDSLAYKKYSELAENEFENAEKIDALMYGFRSGYFYSLKNSAEYLSSTKGEKYLKNYLGSITEAHGKSVSDSNKLSAKDAIISYANYMYNSFIQYEEENGEYIGEQLTINNSFFEAKNEFDKLISTSNPLYEFAVKKVWTQEYK